MRRSVSIARARPFELTAGGLTSEEARVRQLEYGTNDIVEKPPGRMADLLRETAKDPMLWFLVATSALFAAIGDRTEALTLLAAILPVAGMDAYLHRRTQASVAGLSGWLADSAVVVRDGATTVVPARELVPGDLVSVEIGTAFPADGVLIGADNVQVDESALTGEAFPVRKRALERWPAQGPEVAVEGEHWGLAGTRVLTGAARMRVIHTGVETLYGDVVRSALGGSHAPTPLQQAIARLVRVLVVAAAAFCVLLAIVRLLQGYGLADALLSAIMLAVAALPEEFPVVFTFFLGVGVFRLARRNALVRRAVVVENIGRVSCICSDKTGTITEGRLSVTHVLPASGVSEDRLLRVAVAASRGETGDPFDVAVLAAAEQRAVGRDAAAGEVIATFPFTEDRRRECVLVDRHEGRLFAAVKGAPEVVLASCRLVGCELREWQGRVDELAAGGHKVIACAWGELAADRWRGEEPVRELSLAGLLACEDPVREGVARAIESCREGGIHVIMVTGDHPLTAVAVAREIGLGAGTPVVVDGEELAARLARAPQEVSWTARIDVVARAIPAQKLALVESLRRAGHVVAVTGDGVNDVPALTAADVGVAMGGRGTRSAREVASIVLLDDNFRTVVSAIDEGRQLLRNLRMAFAYLLVVHLPFVVTAAAIPLAGYPLLYLPIHIVWMELIIHPTALFVFQESVPGAPLERLDDGRDARFFQARHWALLLIAGSLATLLMVWGYTRSLGDGSAVGHARAMALGLLTLSSAGVAAVLSRLRSRAARWLPALTVLASWILIQTAPLAARLHLAPLHADDWMLVVLGATAVSAAAAPLRAVGKGR